MDSPFDWESHQFSDNWQDLTTIRGLVGGVLSIVSNLVVFALLFLLALMLDAVPQIPAESGGSLLPFLIVVSASAFVGGGWYYLFQRSDRAKELMQTVRGRLAVQSAFYGGFLLLVTHDAVMGIWAALALVFGKGVTLLGIFAVGRL